MDGGLSYEDLQIVIDDPLFRDQLISFWRLKGGGVAGAFHNRYSYARDILGDDFISPQQVAEARGVNYTEAQLASFASTLPSKEVLQWARDNGFAVVAGPPSEMNLLGIHELNTGLFYSKDYPWFRGKSQKFARNDKVGTAWLIVRKGPVPNSTYKMWNEQQALLRDVEYTPNVAEATWFFTTYAAVRGTRLVPNVYVRTSSADSDGDRVGVGYFDGRGLFVNDCRDVYRYGSFGVASARK